MVSQGHKVPEGLRATSSMAEAVEHAEVILMVVPTQFVARTMTDLATLLQPNQVRSAIQPNISKPSCMRHPPHIHQLSAGVPN